MGNIGPSRQHYEVLPAPAFGIDDAGDRTAHARFAAMTVPSPEPMPVPQPEPTPEPNPLPNPDPVPSPPSEARGNWLARTARALR